MANKEYEIIHRLNISPDGGPEVWFRDLADRIENIEKLVVELEANAKKYSMRSAWAAGEGEVARKLRKIMGGE